MASYSRAALAAFFSLAALPLAAHESGSVLPRAKPPTVDLAQAGSATGDANQPTIPILPECAPDVVDKPAKCDTLSEQLNETGGVIQPPTTMDGDIYAPAPDPTPGTTPVIPPSAIPDDPATSVDEGTAVPQ